MATGFENPAEQSTTSLVGGIIADLQNLVEQQFRLFRREIERDAHRAVRAASMLAAGAGVAFLGGFSFCMAAAQCLYWLTSEGAAAETGLPLWGCHAIVSVVLLAIGAALGVSGRSQFNTIKPLESTAVEALKENVEWTTNAPLK